MNALPMPDETKKSTTEWVQFIATVVSPLLLVWVGFANTAIKERVDQQNARLDKQYQQQQKEIERQDKLRAEDLARLDKQASDAREQAKAEVTFTKDTLPNLSEKETDKRRLAVLSMLAYVERGQVSEFMLPILSIHALRDKDTEAHIADDLRTALVDLSEYASRETLKLAAVRALRRLAPIEEIKKLAEGEGADPATKANVQAITQVAQRIAASTEGTSQKAQTTAKEQLALLAPTLSAVAVASNDKAIKEEAATALTKAPGETVLVENAIANVVESLPNEQKGIAPRIYLHIAHEEQRPLAVQIQDFFKRKDWLVPGIQNVGNTKAFIPDSLEVRYLIEGDKSRAEEALNQIRQAFRIQNARVSYTLKGPKADRPGHVELWFPRQIIQTPKTGE
jgi:hypothetical protein